MLSPAHTCKDDAFDEDQTWSQLYGIITCDCGTDSPWRRTEIHALAVCGAWAAVLDCGALKRVAEYRRRDRGANNTVVHQVTIGKGTLFRS